jgi:hypothetical protein
VGIVITRNACLDERYKYFIESVEALAMGQKLATKK